MQRASLEGVSLEFETRGSGEAVALIHLAPYADSYLPLMNQPALAGYKMVRFHRRGYVGSSRVTNPITFSDHASDLANLLNYLGVKRAHIAGHSNGGLVALQLAVDHPKLVGSLVLMEPALRVPASQVLGPASEDLTRRMASGFELYKQGDRERAAEAFLAATFAPGFRELIDKISPGGWAQTVRDADTFFGFEVPALRQFRFGMPEAEKVAVPVLSMRGALSHPAFLEFEELLRIWFPHLETALIPGVDHLQHMQRPDLVAPAMAEFLAKHSLT